MKIRLLSITHKIPTWIEEGYQEYAKRLPPSCTLEIIAIPAEKHSHADRNRLMLRESEKMLALIKPNHRVIALDVQGELWSTDDVVKKLSSWQTEGKNIDLLIGGPEGLHVSSLKRADMVWSLSKLTFPHFLIRVMIAEQIYRAWSILQHHPYHR